MEQERERQGLQDDADVGCDGQAFQAYAMKQESVDRDRDEGDDPACSCGGDSVAGGVEGSRVDALCCPEGDGEGEESEVERGGLRIGRGERSSAKEIDDGRGEGNHPGSEEKRGGEDAGDGAVDGGGEVGEAVLAEERGKEGERGCSGGLAEDAHGGGEEGSGYGEERDAACVVGGEVADDPLVGGDERDADHEGKGEAEPLEEGGVAEVEDGLVAEAVTEGSEDGESSAENDTAENTDGKRVDAEALVKEDCAEDDAEVIDQRCDGAVEEDFAYQESGADDAAEKEEELRGKQKPSK